MYSFQLYYYYSCVHIYIKALKSGKSLVKIESRLQIALFFLFYRDLQRHRLFRLLSFKISQHKT